MGFFKTWSTDKGQNLANATQKALQAASKGASLIILPECFNSPYSTTKFREYAEPLPTSPEPAKSPSFVALAQMAKDTVYSPQRELLAFHRKIHLFDIDVPSGMSFYESDTLSAENKTTIMDLEGYGKIGLGVCYDMRFAELSTIAARQGASALVYPSAFNTTTGPLHWELLGCARAADNQDIVYALLDSETIKRNRMANPITYQRRHDVYPDIGNLVQLDK
ncbi:carbon-nitrogen hydrolase [Aspergillus novoparasiticus]|uniref:Carbon-nitrogen hydrolase n=1 Tax=Aspergillus novoparasiticus TaxID=986946 RepID=A0A5N6F066_9EURO|nr:carbon-nitrogen hydrolase [Aspergillus novoparasiticus]